MKALSRVFMLTAVAMAAVFSTTAVALAHEQRDAGSYHFVVGFIVEPSFEGQMNGVDLRVTRKSDGKPVEGLEKTLKVEITHTPTNTTKTFDLRTIFRDPGHYTNDMLLTAPGQYRFRFFGSIEQAQVNEAFTSGSGFEDVDSSAEIQFPQQLPAVREVAGAVKGAQQAAEQAHDQAGTARTLGIVGVVLGAAGIAAGVGAVVLSRRRS